MFEMSSTFKILFHNGDLTIAFGWMVSVCADWDCSLGVWGGSRLVQMYCCVIFAAELLWGGSLLLTRHQSSCSVCHCWYCGSLCGG
jgi:hypothetical protein